MRGRPPYGSMPYPAKPKSRLYACSNCGQTVGTRWGGMLSEIEMCGNCGIGVVSEAKQRMEDRDLLKRVESWVRTLHHRETTRQKPKDTAKIRRARTRALTRS